MLIQKYHMLCSELLYVTVRNQSKLVLILVVAIESKNQPYSIPFKIDMLQALRKPALLKNNQVEFLYKHSYIT